MNPNEYRCDNCDKVDYALWSHPSSPIVNKIRRSSSFTQYGLCKNNHTIAIRLTVIKNEKKVFENE